MDKKTFNFFTALLLLIICSPVILYFGILICLETGRPIFYLNERIGRKGKKFRLVKFREYYQCFCTDPEYPDSAKALELEKELARRSNQRQGSLYKIANDPRRSAVGRFVEKHYFGELPNLWNVLKGDLSLVGPRPHQARELVGIEIIFPERHSIKPGITGLAQICGASKLDTSAEFAYDREYLRRKGFGLDMWICIQTIRVWLKTWV
jgi:lipopolysaccharide/colanic/teichoic acid biosynthesis glycosyltransferase